MKKTHYAIHMPLDHRGVYTSWAAVQPRVSGTSGAIHRGFYDRPSAEYFALHGAEVATKGDDPQLCLDIPQDVVVPKPRKADLDVYVDGSYYNGAGSWAFVATDSGAVVHEDSGAVVDRTKDGVSLLSGHNIAGELTAVLRAVQWAKSVGKTIRVFHDLKGSALWTLRPAFDKDGGPVTEPRWRRKKWYTQDYAAYVHTNVETLVSFHHVKGHTGNVFNERADQLAAAARSL